MQGVESVALRSADARGEANGEDIPDVAAIFADPLSEGLSGSPIATGGDSATVWIFVHTLPPETVIEPFCKLTRENGEVWSIMSCQLRVFNTRWICACRKDKTNGQ